MRDRNSSRERARGGPRNMLHRTNSAVTSYRVTEHRQKRQFGTSWLFTSQSLSAPSLLHRRICSGIPIHLGRSDIRRSSNAVSRSPSQSLLQLAREYPWQFPITRGRLLFRDTANGVVRESIAGENAYRSTPPRGTEAPKEHVDRIFRGSTALISDASGSFHRAHVPERRRYSGATCQSIPRRRVDSRPSPRGAMPPGQLDLRIPRLSTTPKPETRSPLRDTTDVRPHRH